MPKKFSAKKSKKTAGKLKEQEKEERNPSQDKNKERNDLSITKTSNQLLLVESTNSKCIQYFFII